MDVEALMDVLADVTGIRVEEHDRAPIARNVQRSIERAQGWAVEPGTPPDYVLPVMEREDG
jgi:hypothetical protein